MILQGDCRETLKTLAAESIDSIVTDPPYEIGFMGKGWDGSGVANDPTLWAECYRILKPGGHVLAFGAARTYHRMACAIEDAGFEIRDSIHWVYGSGFPKSHNVSKGIDRAAGAEREVVGSIKNPLKRGTVLVGNRSDAAAGMFSGVATKIDITAPATVDARKWEGWGTALKPAHEPIVMARKPFAGTVAQNVLEHGVGALNIDGARIGRDGGGPHYTNRDATGVCKGHEYSDSLENKTIHSVATLATSGRWPANVILTHNLECDSECMPDCPALEIDLQAETASRYYAQPEWSPADHLASIYTPKAGKRERHAGLDGMPTKQLRTTYDKASRDKTGGDSGHARQNHHPTVKPVALMRYLIRLVTPPGGLVLDPFLGSGTTAVAAILEGFNWVGCELTAEYLPIIEARTLHAARDYPAINTIQNADNSTQSQLGLFGEPTV